MRAEHRDRPETRSPAPYCVGALRRAGRSVGVLNYLVTATRWKRERHRTGMDNLFKSSLPSGRGGQLGRSCQLSRIGVHLTAPVFERGPPPGPDASVRASPALSALTGGREGPSRAPQQHRRVCAGRPPLGSVSTLPRWWCVPVSMSGRAMIGGLHSCRWRRLSEAACSLLSPTSSA